MRSSKSRSRSKSNRPRPMGNIVNRVFDSSGPEGKVRGTPQQIIEKYLFLARDAQLSNDRVAAENFLQHAEHYTRMLGEANREMAAEQEARQSHGGYGQQGNGHGGGQNGGGQNGGGQNRPYADRRDDRGDVQPDVRRDDDRGDQRGDHRGERPRNDGQRRDERGGDGQRNDNHRGDGQRRDDRGEHRNDAQPRGDGPRAEGQRRDDRGGDGQRGENQRRDRRDEPRAERPAPAPVADEQPGLPSFIVDPRPFTASEEDSGLVDTPEARPKSRRAPVAAPVTEGDAPEAPAEAQKARAPRRQPRARKPREDGPDGDGTPREAAE